MGKTAGKRPEVLKSHHTPRPRPPDKAKSPDRRGTGSRQPWTVRPNPFKPAGKRTTKKSKVAVTDEACQPPTASAAATEAPERKREREPEWHATVFGRTLVADIPGRPGHVALRSASVGGKGDRDMVVQRSLFNEAAVLHNNRPDDVPLSSTCYESPPRRGLLRGTPGKLTRRGVVPGTQFLRARREDAIAAIMGGIEPYGDTCDKHLLLAMFLRLEKPETQVKMVAACPEVRDNPEYSPFFLDADGEELPVVTEKMVYDNGGGVDVDYDGSVFSDAKALFKFDGKVIGGAQTSGSGKRGATRRVLVGSDEDSRIAKDAAGSTIVQYVTALSLYDAFVYACRRTTLYESGLYLSGSVVGIATSPHGGKVSLVLSKQGRTRSGQPWMFIVVSDDNWDWCQDGPFPMVVTVGACFSGKDNLAKWDMNVAGLEIGKGMDLSTPRTKGKANYSAEYRGEAKSTNEAKGDGGKASIEERKQDMPKYLQECADGGKADYAEGAALAGGGTSKGTRKRKAEGGKAGGKAGDVRQRKKKGRGGENAHARGGRGKKADVKLAMVTRVGKVTPKQAGFHDVRCTFIDPITGVRCGEIKPWDKKALKDLRPSGKGEWIAVVGTHQPWENGVRLHSASLAPWRKTGKAVEDGKCLVGAEGVKYLMAKNATADIVSRHQPAYKEFLASET